MDYSESGAENGPAEIHQVSDTEAEHVNRRDVAPILQRQQAGYEKAVANPDRKPGFHYTDCVEEAVDAAESI
jgi:hypothetical protein